MTRLAILLALATPAHAVTLDPGDAGVIWTADGFRPVDGVDVYGGGKFDAPVTCMTAYDRHTPAKRPHWQCPRDLGVFAGGALWNTGGDISTTSPVMSPLPTTSGFLGGYTDPAPNIGGVIIGGGCCLPVAPDEPIEPAPVPLPASGWLLVAGLVAMRRMKR